MLSSSGEGSLFSALCAVVSGVLETIREVNFDLSIDLSSEGSVCVGVMWSLAGA